MSKLNNILLSVLLISILVGGSYWVYQTKFWVKEQSNNTTQQPVNNDSNGEDDKEVVKTPEKDNETEQVKAPSYVKKTVKLQPKFPDTDPITLTFDMLSTSKVETLLSHFDTVVYLKDGSKTYMRISFPYEYYGLVTHNSLTSVKSNTITDLSRVRSTTLLADSFAIAYTTRLYSKSECENGSELRPTPTKAPCAEPIVDQGDNSFIANCSVQDKYLTMCDRVMRNIKVTRE